MPEHGACSFLFILSLRCALLFPRKLLKGIIYGCFGDMVDIITHHLLRQAKDDVEYVSVLIADSVKAIELITRKLASIAHYAQCSVMEHLQLFRWHRLFIS